jgi:plastocyanin
MNKMNHLTAGVLLLVATIAAAPATQSGPTTQSSSPVVSIDNFNFTPKVLTIAPGTTVTWINHDDVPHTATAKGKSHAFDSNPLDTDEKFTFTFTTAGTYDYYCKVHPHMTGTIIVK